MINRIKRNQLYQIFIHPVSPYVSVPVCLLALFFLLVLFPLLSYNPFKARQASCMSNLKQIGLALDQYSEDNDGYPPPAESKDQSYNWRSAIYPYVKSQALFSCPSRHGASTFRNGYATDYSVNCAANALFKPGGVPQIRVNSVAHPEKLIALCETYGPEASFDIDARDDSASTQQLWTGHADGSNYLFVDGHVKWMQPTDTDRKAANLWYSDPTQILNIYGEVRLKKTQQLFSKSNWFQRLTKGSPPAEFAGR